MKIILDEQDIKRILTDYVRHNFSPLMELDELKSYTYAPTATFTLEAEDEPAL